MGQVGNLRPIVNRPAEVFEKINNRPISNRPQDAILPHKLRDGLGWKKSSRAAKILMFSNADDRSLSSAFCAGLGTILFT